MTGRREWDSLTKNVGTVLQKAEDAASYTLPTLFLPEGQSTDRGDGGRMYQSVGAQLVNNLATRLMLALFAPSRPFMRLDPKDDLKAAAADMEVTEEELRQQLGLAERKLIRTLDRLALRPKLFELLKHLIVVGNVVSIMSAKDKQVRVLSLRRFRVKRDVVGRVHTLVIKETVLADELPKGYAEVAGIVTNQGADAAKADYYIVVRRDYESSGFTVTEWVNDVQVPADKAAYDARYTEDACPFKVHTWALGDESDYGTSLVMDYDGDFAALQNMSAALIVAGVLASEYRWLVDPMGGANVDDLEESENGEFVNGREGSVTLLNAAGEVAQAMQMQQGVVKELVNRLGRGFIMPSAVTRDAERVTAEEIRMLANELENGLGGGYSRLAVDVQLPFALFLMRLNPGLRIGEKDVEVTVVTGLDALSRFGDLDALRGWLDDVMRLQAAPEPVLRPLNLRAIYADLGTPRGVDVSKYLRDEQEIKNEADAESARAVAEKAAAQGVQTQ